MKSFKQHIIENNKKIEDYYNVFKKGRRINSLIKILNKRGIDPFYALHDTEMQYDPTVRDLARALSAKLRRGAALQRRGISGFDQQNRALGSALPAITRKLRREREKTIIRALDKAEQKYKKGSHGERLGNINSYLDRVAILHTVGRN